MQPNPLDSTTSPLSPLQLKATMKSQEAVKTILPSSQFGVSASCKEVNLVLSDLFFPKEIMLLSNMNGMFIYDANDS